MGLTLLKKVGECKREGCDGRKKMLQYESLSSRWLQLNSLILLNSELKYLNNLLLKSYSIDLYPYI